MYCENCGAKILEGAKFCGGCGAKTETSQPSYAAAGSRTPTRAEPPRPVCAPAVQTPPQPPAYSPQPGAGTLRVGQYIGMLLLMAVPILNIILLFVWSFGGSVNPNKKNFARAALILGAVMLIFWIIAGGLIMGALDSIMDGYY